MKIENSDFADTQRLDDEPVVKKMPKSLDWPWPVYPSLFVLAFIVIANFEVTSNQAKIPPVFYLAIVIQAVVATLILRVFALLFKWESFFTLLGKLAALYLLICFFIGTAVMALFAA